MLPAFDDFPAEQWMHIRTTNSTESLFAVVRLRTKRAKASGSRAVCWAMVFKLTMYPETTCRELNGSTPLPDVIRGVQKTPRRSAEIEVRPGGYLLQAVTAVWLTLDAGLINWVSDCPGGGIGRRASLRCLCPNTDVLVQIQFRAVLRRPLLPPTNAPD